MTATSIAFYLPQFHPTPENDEWWGKGFTEWTNVVRARPRFEGHYQPHLPADLGFYDLRLPETRDSQAAMAREHGITAFCYYHYWFNGRVLLGRPFAEVLSSGSPDLPFCLCWANEDWTRAWDGRSGEFLVRQTYSAEDDRKHLAWLAPALADSRYLNIDGRPLFLVYRAGRIPDPRRTTDIWRAEARALGIGDLFICRVESFIEERGDPRPLGFDAAVEFQPDWANLGPARLVEGGEVFDYEEVIRRMTARPLPTYPRFPCVMPSWDNTARRFEWQRDRARVHA